MYIKYTSFKLHFLPRNSFSGNVFRYSSKISNKQYFRQSARQDNKLDTADLEKQEHFSSDKARELGERSLFWTYDGKTLGIKLLNRAHMFNSGMSTMTTPCSALFFYYVVLQDLG